MARYRYHHCGGTILTAINGDGSGRYYDYCDTCGSYSQCYHPDNEPGELVWYEVEEAE